MSGCYFVHPYWVIFYIMHVFFFLLAMAEVYLKEGDNEYSKGETNNAVHFYSEGLQVNCKDVKLNAKLYSNRAAAQLLLGTNWSIVLDQFCIHFDRDWLLIYSSNRVREGKLLLLLHESQSKRFGSVHGPVTNLTRSDRLSIRPQANWKMGQNLTLKIVNLKEKKRGRKQTDRNSDALRRLSR